MRILTNDGDVDGVALILTVGDEELQKISVDPRYCYDRDFVQHCFYMDGKHAHIFTLFNNGDTKRILRHLRDLIRQYDSVSWWDQGHKTFRIMRRIRNVAQLQPSLL